MRTTLPVTFTWLRPGMVSIMSTVLVRGGSMKRIRDMPPAERLVRMPGWFFAVGAGCAEDLGLAVCWSKLTVMGSTMPSTTAKRAYCLRSASLLCLAIVYLPRQRPARGAGDANRPQSPGLRRRLPPDLEAVPRASKIGLLGEHFGPPSALLVQRGLRHAVHDLVEPPQPVFLDLLRHVVRPRGRLRPFARGILEAVRRDRLQLPQKAQRPLKFFVGLCRESYNNVRRENNAGDFPSRRLNLGQERRARVVAAHQLEQSVAARLNRHVQQFADGGRLRHGRDHGVIEVMGMRAHEPQARDALHRARQPQQLGKPDGASFELAAVAVHGLAEQGDLADPFAGLSPDLLDDVLGGAIELASAHGGHDAVGAGVVAAAHDRHEGRDGGARLEKA